MQRCGQTELANWSLLLSSVLNVYTPGWPNQQPPAPTQPWINPSNAELNPICHLLALLGAHHILHVSRIRVKLSHEAFCNTIICHKGGVSLKTTVRPESDAMFMVDVNHYVGGFFLF
jgi:hypothetical protein